MAMNMGGSNSRMILSEINVTPLVDVMLVLLIMFMVTAPMMQQGIEVDLPKTTTAAVPTQSEDPLIVVVTSDRQIRIAKQKFQMADLGPKLQAIMQTRKSKQLLLQADRRVDYGFVAEAMAEIRAAGITNIGLITAPKNEL